MKEKLNLRSNPMKFVSFNRVSSILSIECKTSKKSTVLIGSRICVQKLYQYCSAVRYFNRGDYLRGNLNIEIIFEFIEIFIQTYGTRNMIYINRSII